MAREKIYYLPQEDWGPAEYATLKNMQPRKEPLIIAEKPFLKSSKK